MEKAKIFQSIVKGSNFFTPIVDSYYTVGNHIVDFQNMSNDKVLEHYYLSIGAESLWNARELIIKAISEQNKLIREGYDEIY